MGLSENMDALIEAYTGPLGAFVDTVQALLLDSDAASVSMESGGALAIIATDKRALKLSIGTRVEATEDDMAQPFNTLMARLIDAIGRAPTMPDLLFTIEAGGLLLYVGPAFIENHITPLLRAF